jgi:UDP-glucose 4-epimerase
MSRVLITGGTGPLGAAVAKRLLADPAYDVRVSDTRPAPRWMREGCEMHRGELRLAAQALAAVRGCAHVVHIAQSEPTGPQAPYALLERESAVQNALTRAALEREVERFVYVSSPLVFERAEQFPTSEEQLAQCPPPDSAQGFAALSGERQLAAAQRERGLEYAICRPFGAYGPISQPPDPGPARDLSELIEQALAGERPLGIFGTGEQRLTPTHVDDLAAGIVEALASPAAANQDFNLAAGRECSLREIAELAWQAGEGQADGFALEALPVRESDVARSHPSARKAHGLLGWEAQIALEQGIATVAQALAARPSPSAIPAPVGA